MTGLHVSFVLSGKTVAVRYESPVGTFITHMEIFMKQFLNTMTLAACVGLASFATSALASSNPALPEHTNQRSVTLHFGDLDPALPADAAELLARVRIAARNACIRNDESRQIFLGPDRKACMAASYANAVSAINAKRAVDLEATAGRYDSATNLSAAR
jgi:UrcA family protein